MKKSIAIIILCCSVFIPIFVVAQNKGITYCISKKQLTGIWQENNMRVGDGLAQSFHFYENGEFILDLSNCNEDVRDILKLKGKYRIDSYKIYFTIYSKITIVEAGIYVGDMGIDGNIFKFIGGKPKEIPIPNPIEIPDPCYISIIKQNHIKINNEEYFKIK